MLTDRVGECRYCGYEPIAYNARECPKCGGVRPYQGSVFDYALPILVIVAILGAAGAAYFFLF